MLLISILIIITFRTLPGLNKNLNNIILATYGTIKIATKLSFIVYSRIATIILILIGLNSAEVLLLPEIGEG